MRLGYPSGRRHHGRIRTACCDAHPGGYQMSANAYDVVIIGAGVNGLAASIFLAKGKKRVLVLERRSQVGGALVTEELIPGYRFDSVTSDAGYVSPGLIKELELRKHGLELLAPEDSLVTPL